MRTTVALLLVTCLMVMAGSAQASIVGVGGPLSALGAAPAIIAAPPDANEDAAYNLGMEGFDERQRVVLTSNIATDQGVIAAGTFVSSHMIFLNTGPGNNTQANSHFGVNWTFDGIILGVMSNYDGSMEMASTPQLGAIGTLYPSVPFNARGLESNVGPEGPNDGYSFAGNTLSIGVGMYVTEPGDWIRVVTSAVPEPGTITLLGLGLIGLAVLARKRA